MQRILVVVNDQSDESHTVVGHHSQQHVERGCCSGGGREGVLEGVGLPEHR